MSYSMAGDAVIFRSRLLKVEDCALPLNPTDQWSVRLLTVRLLKFQELLTASVRISKV